MQRDGGPGGPAGGGNPTGGSFTGPAEALEIAGDFAYAYSGEVNVQSGGSTMLDFRTGNFLFVGTLQIFSTDTSGEDAPMDFNLNGVTAISQKFVNTGQGPDSIYPINIMIPAYTDVSVVIDADGRIYSAAITGRIYRG